LLARLDGHKTYVLNVYSSSVDFLIFPRETGDYLHSSVRHPLPLLVALLPVALLASAIPQAHAQNPLATQTGYTVRGTVMNSVTNQPVARALVAFSQDQAMLTDSNGQFSFPNIAAGSYSVSVTKPGYQGHGDGGMMRIGRGAAPLRPEPPLRIQVGPDTPALTLSITPLGSIVGHITLSTADPPDGIRVQVITRRLQNGHPHWVNAGQVRVRNDGSFRIDDLEPGSYIIASLPSLDRPGLALNSREPVWGYPSLYYPGTTDFSAAGILNLGPGQQAEADFTLTRRQFFPVLALVHSSTDTPANFAILDTGGRPTGLFANWDRRDGLVHAVVPDGTWTLDAHVYGRTLQFGSTTFQVNGAPATLAINIQPVPHIPVIIRRDFVASADASQPPVPGPGMNIELTSADERSATVGSMTHTDDSSAASNWELNITEPGRYWLKVEAYQPAYVSSISSGGVDLGSNPLVVIPGSTPQAVEVTLRNDGGSIAGDINGLNPSTATSSSGQSPQLWIYAIPLFSTAAALRDVIPNSDGHFSFNNLPPGSYRVVACDAPQEIDFHSADALAAWTGKGQVVTVDPNGAASVDLDIVHMNAGATQ
jgi:Carboxypeptidase regulatory-like domain